MSQTPNPYREDSCDVSVDQFSESGRSTLYGIDNPLQCIACLALVGLLCVVVGVSTLALAMRSPVVVTTIPSPLPRPTVTAGPNEQPVWPPAPLMPQQIPVCANQGVCPADYAAFGGGYYCGDGHAGSCRPGAAGPWPSCIRQCRIREQTGKLGGRHEDVSTGGSQHQSTGGDREKDQEPGKEPGKDREGTAKKSLMPEKPLIPKKPLMPKKLTKPGRYDLRVMKGNRLFGCAAPIGLFPGQPKYGCGGKFGTAKTCDAAAHPVKDTAYVKAVHLGCETAEGRGTYGYAYDDGVGLKQCSPMTRYEWVLCPTGSEDGIHWMAKEGKFHDSARRFRITNKCSEPIWIQQAGSKKEVIPHEPTIRRIDEGAHYTYSIPNKGLPSTRFLPKTGCDGDGNNCDIQSMPPCPEQGCDLPVDTKFEASWGCLYWNGTRDDKRKCSLTGQGHPSTYQDWWDGSAVDGWTLPFTVLVDDGGRGLVPGSRGSPAICGNVVCAKLIAANLCPRDEFLTPESEHRRHGGLDQRQKEEIRHVHV
mmetsp:Transcript_96781/g.269109  ORF Transcript_96781/g.269109 Transcript_96781/m.269109 type:complete len:532 (+) Transcript_96781:87-1682(+)|eukprot:CAMPEP_0179117030 /NCGR_PEP_ID=MMETSP0796-20121207/54937_1 /TAXON_ID=73915 /ORGANISM="Pyrodinium bahamense, Strain pbaha01" /LENGTH=531 /DNA_ID=CAMNT_0020815363 /DNA_START=52 /DNA_END=1647 /DNA_ORIENTATION=-